MIKLAKSSKEPEVFASVTEGLKKLYKTKLLPLEEHYRFHEFHSPPIGRLRLRRKADDFAHWPVFHGKNYVHSILA
jgi:hypothetical protein